MKAVWNDQVLAEADKDELVSIEGNWYFPPGSINQNFFTNNDEHSTCIWKGEASYYDINVNGKTNQSGAWFYPHPKEESIDRVKKDFSNYVAFWRGVEIVE